MSIELGIKGYEIEREIGSGGMATVYLARQVSLGRNVALKVMSPGLTGDAGFTSRFLREGATLAKLVHPKIIKVFDLGESQHRFFLSMEYLTGGTLKQRIEKGLALEDALQIMKCVTEALGYAHEQGVVHRDVKASNIIHRRDGVPVLTDFGVAKVLSSNTVLTATGSSVGTPHYMSPEQFNGSPVDHRVDIYALGILFYEMLTGDLPYRAETPIAIGYKHIHDSVPKLPAKLQFFQPLLERMLAKDRDQRLSDAKQILQRLRSIENEHGVFGKNAAINTGFKKAAQTERKITQHSKGEKENTKKTTLKVAAAFAVLAAFGAGGINFFPDVSDQQQESAGAAEFFVAGNYAASAKSIQTGLLIDPENTDLPSVNSQIKAKKEQQVRTALAVERRATPIETLPSQAISDQQAGEPTRSPAAIDDRLAFDPKNIESGQLRIEKVRHLIIEAQQGLRLDAASALLQEMRANLTKQREQAHQADEQARLVKSQAEKEVPAQIAALLQTADRQSKALSLTTPPGNNAHETFLAVLALDKDNAEAHLGLQKIVEIYLDWARSQKQKGNYQKALGYLDRARKVIANDTRILALRSDIEAKGSNLALNINSSAQCANH